MNNDDRHPWAYVFQHEPQLSGAELSAYTYDNLSNIVTTSTDHDNYAYGYDAVSRLTMVDNPTLDDEAYTYDGVGNRETASNISGDIEQNQNNELQLYGDISFAYDANGNMVSQTSDSESWAYTYNVQNRLVQVEEDDLLIAEYGYDPFGRRLWKEVDGERTYFFYADEGLVAEYDETGAEIRSYGYQPDSVWTIDPLWLKEDGEYYWYQNDHLGTPQKLVDSTGTVVWSAQYTAFGEADVQVETVTNNLRFPGQYYDEETGLLYNYQRYYDPRVGRYLRVDPIGFDAGDVNLYAYGWNSPVNRRDVMGLRDCKGDQDKQKFFNWLFHSNYDPTYPFSPQNIRDMARSLGIDENLLITLAVKEGGWSNYDKDGNWTGDLDKNIKDNNPFGMNYTTDGRASGNRKFNSFVHAIDFWMKQPKSDTISYSERIRQMLKENGSISEDDFIDALLCDGSWKGKCKFGYNEDKVGWRILFEQISAKELKEACSEVCDLNCWRERRNMRSTSPAWNRSSIPFNLQKCYMRNVRKRTKSLEV